jgi:diketogulonate reductase-like aldo/keto reductase
MIAMSSYHPLRTHLLIVVLLNSRFSLSDAWSSSSSNSNNNFPTRRDVLMGGGGAAGAGAVAASVALSIVPSLANAQFLPVDGAVDMAKINAVRSATAGRPTSAAAGTSVGILPVADPSPTLLIRNAVSSNNAISIPRIGYSLYKTPFDQAERCTRLALRAGIRHFDVATGYGSNAQVAKALAPYLNIGMAGLDFSAESLEVLDRLDAIRLAGEQHAAKTNGGGADQKSISPAPLGSAGRRGRREGLFIHHKISNQEQSTDPVAVRRSVKQAIEELGCLYLDMVSIHSPLTDKSRRLTSYQALLDLKESGFIKSVGVCNYGLTPLQEIAEAGLDLPAVNQLELSPFNAHQNVVDWCNQNGIAVSCSAWSRLSSADGPTEGWDALAKVAQQKEMTKAQVLVRWALQKGYICVPRSSSASKLERIAIAENSYGGVNPSYSSSSVVGSSSFLLTPEEMKLLDSLDVAYPAGKLGRRDGWLDTDVTGPEWDPTHFQ